MENITLIIIDGLIGLVILFIGNWVRLMDNKISNLEKGNQQQKDELSKTKLNYQDRFLSLERLFTDKFEANAKFVGEKFDDLRNHMDATFVTKDLCKNIQMNREKNNQS